jgi:hypothetical protein
VCYPRGGIVNVSFMRLFGRYSRETNMDEEFASVVGTETRSNLIDRLGKRCKKTGCAKLIMTLERLESKAVSPSFTDEEQNLLMGIMKDSYIATCAKCKEFYLYRD